MSKEGEIAVELGGTKVEREETGWRNSSQLYRGASVDIREV